jgi:hypothetical protein
MGGLGTATGLSLMSGMSLVSPAVGAVGVLAIGSAGAAKMVIDGKRASEVSKNLQNAYSKKIAEELDK